MNKIIIMAAILVMISAVAYGNGVSKPQASAPVFQEEYTSAGTGMGPSVSPTISALCPSSVAVDSTFVYVLRNGELTKLNKSTLQIVSITPISTPAASGAGASITSFGVMSNPMIPRPMVAQFIQSLSSMSASQATQEFLQAAIQSHLGSIAWSRLAVNKATHSELSTFAQNVIDNETKANQLFSSILTQRFNTTATTSLIPLDTQILNNLRNMNGRDFEIAYMQAMIQHFSEVIAVSQFILTKTDNADLRNAITSMSGVHQQHISQLRTWLSSWYNVTL